MVLKMSEVLPHGIKMSIQKNASPLPPGLSMRMGYPWESHRNCPMGWDRMGLHALCLQWDQN